MLNERDKEKLNIIIQYCSFISKIMDRINNDFNTFENDFEAQQSISFDILQIGESINKISQEIRDKYSDIPWRKIIAMRNFIVYEYGTIDYNILFQSALNNIPELSRYCKQIIDNETQ